ncbi:cytochrome P450 [Epidermidibacterium keratini]|uniref:Cytochrome P450 n=1 Tax=Epidermidibacterium keratini TaxID=1891644 RepID=A0A7L4YQJ3_9ACTN|nr:cytochrome P450 [Epidermidibacterium keratini]QHC01328.1 cytochrome P450 [Epidermidibacterium keratini]
MRVSDQAFIDDPYPTFAAMRAEAPVQWSDELGMYVALSYDAVSQVLRTRTLGRIWEDFAPGSAFEQINLIHRHALLEMEPPDHTRLRRLVATAFSRGHVERLRPRVAALAAELADDVADAGSGGSAVDLLSVYAEPLPVAVIGELLGVPRDDWPLLRPWSNAIVKMYEYDRSPESDAAAEQAASEFAGYLRELAAVRRTRLGDDLISDLLRVQDADGQKVTDDELIATGILLLNAGHEATVNTTGNGLAALLQRPDQLTTVREGLSDPAVIAAAGEEMLRFDGPLQLFERTATAPTEIAGTTIEAGQKIAALLGSANHDPAVFADPAAMDVTRDPNPHVGFGLGIHFCLGAPLARVEIQTSLQTLLARFPALRLAAEPRHRPEFVIRGLEQLQVTTR